MAASLSLTTAAQEVKSKMELESSIPQLQMIFKVF